MAKKTSPIRRTLHYYWAANKKYKLYTIGTFLCTPIALLSRIAAPLILAYMIEIASSDLAGEEMVSALLPYGALFLLNEFLRGHIIGPLRLWCHWKMEICTMYDLNVQCFDVVEAQSMQFHSNKFSGSLVSQTNKFISAYERFMDEIVWNVVPTIMDVVVIMAIMFPRVPLYAAGILAFMAIFIVVSIIWSKKMTPLNEHEASMGNKRTGQLSDAITNIMAVKSYAREKYEHKRFEKWQKEVFNASYNALKTDTARNYCFDTIFLCINVLIVVLLVFGRQWFALPLSTLILIVNYSSTLMRDLWDVHSIFKTMNRVFGDSKEMTEILDTEDDVVDAPDAKKMVVTDAEIEFDNITFRHEKAKEKIFENFSLKIMPGERVGLVGVSGSGKTTLTKLLLRFADVKSGSITIDGQDVSKVTQDSLREAIAYVPQESSLFHRSIFENIAYGRPDATDEEVFEAARLANADEFIARLPDGYDTMVGERGVKLSGGQRQRIAIARAILKDAPILVLDEATSALDSESEAAIQGALSNLMEGRTSIVVAHRLSTIAGLDKIVVLRDGKIIEMGSHKELLSKKGEYAKLWSRQSGAFLDEQ